MNRSLSKIEGSEAVGAFVASPFASLADLAEARFRECPDAVAVIDAATGTELTYKELDQRTAALAAALIARGAGPERIVAVVLPRSLDMVIAIFAALRAGAAFMPINPDDPASRKEELLTQADPVVVIASEDIGAFEALTPAMWPEAGQIGEIATPRADTLAYVLFTSGSTGAPKGVMVEHGSILSYLGWQANDMSLNSDDRMLLKSPITFDGSMMELFCPLVCGGTLVIAPEGAQRDPHELVDLVERYAITMTFFVPTMLDLFLDAAEGRDLTIRNISAGGEPLTARMQARFHAVIDGRLQHVYGPTETVVGVAHCECGADDVEEQPPIGWPTWETRLYVLDEAGNRLADGEIGRLWIAGRQVARGYLGRADLTDERFRPDPFVAGERMYDSGDLAERRADGAFVYRGRADQQVKIGGMRLELGEVEAALQQCAAVAQAAVVALSDDKTGDTRLIAYCVTTGAPFDEAAVRAEIARVLPRHAVPQRILATPELPVTTSGKVDRKALRARPVPGASTAEALKAPHDLVRLVRDELAAILGAAPETLDVAKNFFDLGATSLQLVRLAEALRARLKQEVPVRAFFEHGDILTFARHFNTVTPAPEGTSEAPERREVGSDAIAIIGMAGRFPGAPDVASFWQALLEERELISHFSDDELEIDPRSEDPDGAYVLSRGVVDGAADFDAAHFGIPPREAAQMDPQHRIMLELARTALDDAGHDPDRFAGRIGIFAGGSQNSYLLANILSAPGAARTQAARYPVAGLDTHLGNDKDFLATRVAYKLGLKGPAMTVQTACSTSLVAVGQGCDALRSGQADMVLAGGISITFPSRRPYAYLAEGMASADGHCRTFDAEASGTVFGDGAGLVVLRRLDDALADGDHVVAVIRGHAINNDGADKAGYAAPSVKAQADVIRAAHVAARVGPRDIGYVEAHGTATPLGDPIEFAALDDAFGGDAEGRGYCALGSVKTNTGHLDIAAGITGLIKTALVMKHRKIPSLLHYRAPNPAIDFERSAFYPVTEARDWPEGARCAGVSAFGVGGTNVHMVLETFGEAGDEGDAAPDADERPRVLPVSATSPEALAAAADGLRAFAVAHPGADIDALAATLRDGRTAFSTRGVLVARDMAGLAATGAIKPARAALREGVAFLFPGQGAQHVGMARDLYRAEPVFRAAFDRCCDVLAPELGVDLREVIHASDADAEAMTERLRNTALAQPAIFSVEYALVQQWAHWGIAPEVMVGHSIGEFAAATVAGVFALDDALKLIAQRGRLMADLPTGAMVSVRASAEAVEAHLGDDMDLAAVNGAELVVVAGPDAAAADFIQRLEVAGIEASRLQTSHAFHSRMMDPVLEDFRAAVAAIDLRAPTTPILSTVTGDWLSDDEATDPAYWANHMRRPVRFYDALQVLWAEARLTMIEAGPGRTLATLARQAPNRKSAAPVFASLPHAQAADGDSHVEILSAFGGLWSVGHAVDWTRLQDGRAPARKLAGVPTYPFQRKRHWVEPVEVVADGALAPREAEAPGAPEAAEAIDTATDIRATLVDLSGLAADDLPGAVPFLELGFDSLLLTQVAREISGRYRVPLALRQLIDGLETIDALAAYVDENGATAPKAAPAPAPKAAPAPERASETPAAVTSAPITTITRDTEALTPVQTAHIDRLVKRFNAKTATSKALTQRYRPVHADPRTASGFNRLWKDVVYQIVSDRSKGSRLIDVDGNEYVDLLNGFGPGFLGHNSDMIRAAVERQMDKGYEVGPQHLVAMEAAQLFCDVTGNERASFVCTGSEAVAAAMRLARTTTQRDTIATFRRDYHGNFDEVLVRGVDGAGGPKTLPLAPGIPRDSVKNIVTLEYGTPESLDWIRRNADSLAAVVAEPVQSRRPEFVPVEFMREVRAITENAGALLVFDEVVNGFRFGPHGAQGLFGIEADLVTYGKIVGGEMPVGVVAGKARYMDTFDGGQWQYGDDSFPDAPVTFFAGTFVRHPLAMAAAHAMLTHFKAQPALYWRALDAKGDRLGGELSRWFADNDMPFEMPNCGSLLYFRIGAEQRFGGLFGAHLRDRGVFYLEGFPSYLTVSHDDEDIDHTIAAFKDAALEMRADGMLTGREAVAYDGPAVHAAPPRLSLPEGAAQIARDMATPVTTMDIATTGAQREIWTAVQITPELRHAYNECATVELRGAGIDVAALEVSVRQAIGRHDALSAVFAPGGERLRLGAATPPVTVADISDVGDIAAEAARLVADEVTRDFDLEKGPLAAFTIIRRGADAVDLLITGHHIVFDGWSAGTILRDICQGYRAARGEEHIALAAPDAPATYVRRERDWITGPEGDAARAFWVDTFDDMPTPVALPADHPRGATRDVTAERLDFVIPPEVTARLRAASKGMGATLFTTLFAAFKLFVAARTGRTDLTVAVPSAGQLSYDMDRLVFHGVNLVPVRSAIDLDAPFRDVVRAVGRGMAGVSEHQKLTYGEIVRALGLSRSLSQTPLTTLSFNLDPALGDEELDFTGTRAELVTHARRATNFEIELNLADKGDEIAAEWTYQSAVFDAATIRDFMQGYLDLLARITKTPEVAGGALLCVAGGSNAPSVLAGPTSDIPDAPLHALVAAQVQAHPDAVAIETRDGAWTYADLDLLSARIATTLVDMGVRPGDYVGLAMERGPRAVAALLAVLRAGAAYVPLDPAFPKARLQGIVEDCDAALILADTSTAEDFEGRVAVLDDAVLPDVPGALPDVSPTEAAYVLYTSGSTGRPKGVPLSHRSFNNFIRAMAKTPGLYAGGRTLAFSTFSFDIAGLELWGPLTTGGTIVLAERGDALDPVRLGELAATCDLIQATPTTYRMLQSAGWHGHKGLRALVGGEKVSRDLADQLLADCAEVWNVYGPTETTVWSTIQRLDPDQKITVGRPIDNMEMRVVVPKTEWVVPHGTVGELVISGVGLSKGYIGRPELNAEVFTTLDGPEGTRVPFYRTGDLARVVPGESDPVLDLVGRTDDQVKIRGFRIEIGEIEAQLRALSAVDEVGMLVLNAKTPDAYLGGLVTLQPGATLDEAEWRSALGAVLPHYMVPNVVHAVDALPKTPNRKLNRILLPGVFEDAERAAAALAEQDTGPETEMQRLVIDIWSRLFDHETVSLGDNFFHLGGHSLMAVKLFDEIRKATGRDWPISTLFEHQTARSLAEALDETQDAKVSADATEAAADVFDPDGPWDNTVVIHPGPEGSTASPVFIVGGVGGNVNNLYQLGQELGRSRKVVAIQMRGVLGHRPHTRVEDIARDNIANIRRHQAEGPYTIAGYSAGAYAALEMARQLEAAGETVSHLVPIDMFAPGFEKRVDQHLKRAAKSRLSYELDLLRKGGLRNLATRLVARVRYDFDRSRLRQLRLKEASVSATRLHAITDSWHIASRAYAGGPVNCPVTLFLAEPSGRRSAAAVEVDPTIGWSDITAPGRLDRIDVSGNHVDMIIGPRVPTFAAKFLAAIEGPKGSN